MKFLEIKVYKVWTTRGSVVSVRASGFDILSGMVGFYVETADDNYLKTKNTFKWFSVYNIVSIEIDK